MIVLGFSVFAPFSNYFVFGVTVAALSVFQLVYRYGEEAGISKEQMKQYKKLLILSPSLSDEELQNQYITIQNSDSNPWRTLEHPAYIVTCLYYDLEVEKDMTWLESAMSRLAGGYPIKRKGDDGNNE